MTPRPREVVGLGAGLAAAGVAAATGVAAGRANRDRRARYAVLAPEGAFAQIADKELSIATDDGVALHVEIDEPDPQRADPRHPTVVLTHGYTLSLRSWVLQRRALTAAGYRVVLWDQRSHGQSEVAGAPSCTIDQLGRDLHRVILEAVPDGQVVLVGHSMGGMTMMSLAEQFPQLIRERVVAAAFVATSAGAHGVVTLGFGHFLGRLLGRAAPEVLARLGTRQDWLRGLRRVGRGVEDRIVEHYSFASPVSRATVRFTGDQIFGTSFTVMADFLPTINVHDKRTALAAFHGVETLVVNGMQDLLTPPEHSAEIVRLIPGAEHVVVNDAGHIIMLEHPQLLDEQLLALIERGERASASGLPPRAPRVRRTVTDLTKRRKVAGARATSTARADGSPKPSAAERRRRRQTS